MRKSEVKQIVQLTLYHELGRKIALNKIEVLKHCSNDGCTLQSAVVKAEGKTYELVYSTVKEV